MNTLNIVTEQDKLAFEHLKDVLLNEHGKIDWSFTKTNNKEEDAIRFFGMVQGVYYVWMMNGKKEGTYSRRNHNIDLKAVSEFLMSL